jgi:hypothetical protein
MDFGDFFTTTAEIGTSGSGRFRLVYFGAAILLGAGLGGYAGYSEFLFSNLWVGIGTGGLLGWFFAALLRGLLAFIVIAVIFIAVMLGWQYLTGAGL